MDGARRRQPKPSFYEDIHKPEPETVEEPLYIPEFGIDTETDQHSSLKKEAVKKTLIVFSFLLVTFFLFYGVFVFWKIYSVGKKITIEENPPSFASEMKSAALSIIPSKRTVLAGEDRGRVNILLLGAAGEKKPGSNLTDTVMLASIDTKSKKVALLSLPRDLYVKIPASTADGSSSDSYSKINSLYQIGLRSDQGAGLIREAVEDVTGQKIDYYLTVDFDGFTKFVDTLGGITVNVERDIYDSRYPGPNYSYETFELKKGVQVLDGATALKYVRERHDDPQGDFGRAKRQQQTLQAVKNKAFSLETFLNISTINGLLTTLENNIRTDLTLSEMESFLFLIKEADTQNVSTKVVDAWKSDSLLKVSHVFFGETRAFILVPKVGTYSQIRDLAENIFDIQKIERRKEEFSKEDATIAIVNESGDAGLPEKIKRVVSESLGIEAYRIETTVGEKTRTKTEIADATRGAKIFTLDELIKITPASLSQEVAMESSAETDFTLYLGKDLVGIYKYEEVSKEEYEKEQEKEFEF